MAERARKQGAVKPTAKGEVQELTNHVQPSRNSIADRGRKASQNNGSAEPAKRRGMIMMTFPALLLAVFGYSAILEYKNKKAMNDEIQLHDGPQSEAQKNKERIALLKLAEQYPKGSASEQTLIDQASK